MKKQTAVEWLIKKLYEYEQQSGNSLTFAQMKPLLEQAKEMEENTIWTPSTITEWLEERIEFTNTILNSAEVIDDNQKAQMVSDFTLANQNFTYCLKLYNERSNTENLRLFKNLALKLLFDISYEWDKVENRCVTIHGITFPINEKNDFLPQKFWDTQKKWRDALSNIYNQIMEL
jgi:hypothetical protein